MISCGKPGLLAKTRPWGHSGSPASSRKPFPFFSEPWGSASLFPLLGATCYFQLLLSASWNSVGQKSASPLWPTLFTPTAVCAGLAMCRAWPGFRASQHPGLSFRSSWAEPALTARNRSSYQILRKENVLQAHPACLSSSWDRRHLSLTPFFQPRVNAYNPGVPKLASAV